MHALLLSVLLSLACTLSASSEPTAALFAAVARDDAAAVRAAILAGAHIDERGAGGQTPLVSACLGGKAAAAAVLLELGADATLGEKDGYTPLHAAAFQGRAQLVRLLLAHPAVPNERHRDGFFPLHRACWGRDDRYPDTIAAFLEAGVDPRLATLTGETPLQLARKAGNAGSVATLKAALKARKAAARAKAAEDAAPLSPAAAEL